MIQGRVPDPTGQNPGGVWVTPVRDIAHCGPYLIRAALTALTAELESPERGPGAGDKLETMTEYAKCLAAFIRYSCGEERITGDDAKVKAFRKSGLLQQSDAAHKLFGKWMARAFLGAVFDALGNALHPGEIPLGIAELMACLTDIAPSEDEESQ